MEFSHKEYPPLNRRAPTARVLAVVYLPVVIVIGFACLLSTHLHKEIGFFTRDPAAIARLHPFVGLLSNIGALLWCAAGSVCLFAAGLLSYGAPRVWSRFFLAFGAFTWFLLLDDLFLFHEKLGQSIHPALHGFAVRSVYVLVCAALLWKFRRVILQASWPLLVAALSFFSISFGLDQLVHAGSRWYYLFEDGSKLLGIAGWCSYFISTAYQALFDARVVQRSFASESPRQHEPLVVLDP